MVFEKGEKYSFTVRDFKDKWFYIVDGDGDEWRVKAFEFQCKKACPENITCICKDVDNNGRPMLMQDISMLLPQIYKVGETYEFKIKRDLTDYGYYEVVDTNGFILRLTSWGNARLYVNQVVNATVKSINIVRVELSLAEKKDGEGIPFYSPEKVFEFDGCAKVSHTRLRLLFDRLPIFAEARRQYGEGNSLWLLTAVETVEGNLAAWLSSEFKGKEELLKTFHSVCTNLLENSDYLANCSEQECVEYQGKLSTAITHAKDYINALEYINRGNYSDYIKDILDRLDKSGYLYNAEEKMRTIMSLFTLRKDSVRVYIQDIFDIIRERHANEHFMSLFRNAFIEMLDIYIGNEKKQVDRLTSLEDSGSRQRVKEMVEATAIQLLLVKTVNAERPDINILRSMLYRYASSLADNGAFPGWLLNKAFGVVCAVPSDDYGFGWKDLGNVYDLCTGLALASNSDRMGGMQTFDGDKAAVVVGNSSISVMPTTHGELKHALHSSMFAPDKIQVMLNEKAGEKVSAATTNIDSYRRLWSEVEKSLFASKPADSARGRKKITPDVGTEVMIRITGVVPAEKCMMKCRIEDDVYTGEGVMATGDIVRYPMHARMESYTDKETGKPYLLKAVVKSIDNHGRMTFGMLDLMKNFISESVEEGDEILAQITKETQYFYICTTEWGYAVNFSKHGADDTLKNFDFVNLVVKDVKSDGRIDAEFESRSDRRFSWDEAFDRLIEEYADGTVYESVPESDGDDEELTKSAGSLIGTEAMHEIIQIIDRKGALQKGNLVRQYNYSALARVLALAAGDNGAAAYYEARCGMIKSMQYFEKNDKFDDLRLKEITEKSKGLADEYPDVGVSLTQLGILNCLDKPGDEDLLWREASVAVESKNQKLARLVLSYNILNNLKVYEPKRDLREKIYQLMDLNIKMPEKRKVASENEYTELKSSMFYSAARNTHMLPNERLQMSEILSVVCGFLNGKGGKLYIGVNDMGYAVGLHDDFVYLNGMHEEYDLGKIKDTYDSKFRGNVHKRLGVIANENVSAAFENIDGKLVYAVDIKPCADIVKLDEKTVFTRQGTSTWPVPSGELSRFAEQRRREGRK